MVNTFYTPFNLSGRHPYADFDALIEAARLTLEYPAPGDETNGLSLIGVSATPGTAQPCFTLAGKPHTLAPCEGEYIVVDGYVDHSACLPPAAISIAASARDNRPADAGTFARPEELAAWMRRVAKPFTARPGDDGYDAAKKGMPAFGPSYQGKTRGGANAVDVPYILLDADAMDGVSPDALIAACKQLGPGLAWASLSSTDAAPRRKILIWMAAPVDKLNAKAAARALLTRLGALMPGVRIEYGSGKSDARGARVFFDQSQQAGGQLCFLPAQGAHIETWGSTPAAVEYEGQTVTAREFNPAADDGDDTHPRAVAAIECLGRLDFADILEIQDSGAARETIKTAIMAARYEGVSRAHLWGKLAGVADETIRRYRFDDLIEREQATVANPVGIGALRQLAQMDVASVDEFPLGDAPPRVPEFGSLVRFDDTALADLFVGFHEGDIRIDDAGTIYWWDDETALWIDDDGREGSTTDRKLREFLKRATRYFADHPKDPKKANPISTFTRESGYKNLRAMARRTAKLVGRRLPANANAVRFKLMTRPDTGGQATVLDLTAPALALRQATRGDFGTAFAQKAVVIPAPDAKLEDIAPNAHKVLAAMFSNAPDDLAAWHGQIETEQIDALCVLLGYALTGGWGSQKVGVITGARRCGKSSIIQMLRAVLGGSLFYEPPVRFLGSMPEGGNDQALYQAQRAYVAYAEEATELNVLRLNTFTNETVNAMGKGVDVRTVLNRTTVIATTNGFALTGVGRDVGEARAAARERLYLLEAFTTTPEEDRDPGLSLRLAAEAPAFLGYCVARFHAHAWRSARFEPSLPQYEWMHALIDRALLGKADGKSVGSWAAAHLIADADGVVDAFDMLNAYRVYAGEAPLTSRSGCKAAAARKRFAAQLTSAGFQISTSGKAHVIKARYSQTHSDF